MADLTTLTELDLSANEYCYIVGNESYMNSSFKLRIPKFMPLMAGSENSTRIYFNKYIFINDSGCIPTPNNYIQSQNYLTVKRSPTCTMFSRADSQGIIPKGTSVRCTCLNNDIKNLVITDVV